MKFWKAEIFNRDFLTTQEGKRKSTCMIRNKTFYHNVREEVAAQEELYILIYYYYSCSLSAMTGEYADMIRKHFMKLVTPRDHKFAALHGAVWSGGSFVYVPPGVSVEIRCSLISD